MKKVLSFLKPYLLHMGVAWFLMLIELFVELFHPLLLERIIDQGVLPRNTSMIWFYGLVMMIISIIAFAAGLINSFYASHVSQSYGFDLRETIFEKIQGFSLANFNQFPTSSLITRMTNDVLQMQNTAFMSLRIMVRAPLLVLGSIIMALFIDFKLAIFFGVAISMLFPFLLWILRRGGELFQLVQQKIDYVNNVMRENLSGMRWIKAFVRGEYEVKRFTKANTNLMRRTVSALRFMQKIMPILLLVMNMTIILVLWFGHKQVSTDQIKVGEVVAIINYGMRMTAAFSMLTFIIMAFSRARASADRIARVLESENSMSDVLGNKDRHEMKLEGRVTFDQVSFRYPDYDDVVLKNISFDVWPGETIAVLGATGSGKSSLFQLIPRLYDVTEGAIRVDQVNVKSMKQSDLRQQIGYVPQESLLFTGTIKDNILWGKADATQEDIIQAAKDAQILETINKLPLRFDTIIGQKGINLSGGQKQRLAIARALVRHPSILLLDDSTSALDLKTESKLLESLKQYKCTTFIITQKISTALEADYIFILEEGMLIAKGNHEELINNTPLYQKIYESQLGEGSARNA